VDQNLSGAVFPTASASVVTPSFTLLRALMRNVLKELIIQGCSTAELKQEAIRLGFRTLRMSALSKVKLGVTTLSEAVGNTAPDKF
jgi:hypothetical protein